MTQQRITLLKTLILKEATMLTTQSNSYLIVAKYNYAKWKALVQQGGRDVGYAERAAEKLFPELKIPLFSEDDPPEPFRPGLKFVGTFVSDIFGRLPPLPEGVSTEQISPQQKVELLDPIIAEGLPKPPVGWLAVVDQSEVAAFVQDMSAYGGYLWEMYDIQISMLPDNWTPETQIDPLGPFNPDKTTEDIYLNMSIRNWS
jgi:hypothetical protein